jgi:hypothetical protein
MSQSRDTGEDYPLRWKAEVIINIFLLLVAIGAAFFAGWAAWEASRAADETKETRFADNLPAWKVFSRSMEEGKSPQPPITIANVGKGPGHILGFGYSDLLDKDGPEPKPLEVIYPDLLKECVAPGCEYRILPANFDEVAKLLSPELQCENVKGFNELLAKRPDVLAGERRYFIQFSDVFKNQYRQYFYFDVGKNSVTCYGRFVICPIKENEDYWAWPPPPPYKPDPSGKDAQCRPWW